jgi:hypothetical protein
MEETHRVLQRVSGVCRKVGWVDIARQGERLLAKSKDPELDAKELKALTDDFGSAVQEKLVRLVVVAIEDRDTALFASASGELCGGALHQNIAISEEELDLAGRALALGLSTAAVSHAMRSIEASLHLIGKVLAIPFSVPVDLMEWANLTDRIAKEIKAQEQQPRSQAKSEQLKQFAELLVPADGFRLAWRNHVAHAREKYEDPEARRILGYCGHFLRKLSDGL